MMTFADVLHHAARSFPNATAVVCGEDIFTYPQFIGRCRRLVGALKRLGAKRGDRVAILSRNCHRYLELYAALPAGGFVIVPLNVRHAESEIRYALEDSGAKFLFTDREPGALTDCVERVVRLPEDYEALLETAPEAELGRDITQDSLAGVFYTGGTTGASKGVMLTHHNLIANTLSWLLLAKQTPNDVYLVIAPLFHAAGSLSILATIWTGGCQVVLPAFEANAAIDAIERYRVTVTLGVPTMVAALAEKQLERARDTSSLRFFCHGGSPIATEVIRRAHAVFPSATFVEVYGATELSPLATAFPGEEAWLSTPRAQSCGQPIIGVDVRIVGAKGSELGTGEVGEIVVRGANVMRGYWKKPQETEAVLRDGWYHTGDLGYFDEENYLYIVDRAKDMIVSGGENVYSTEVEEVLYRHTAVLEAAVFGVPDDHWGEAVHAVVVLRSTVSAEDLVAHCRGSVAGYKVPKTIEIRSEPLPKSGAGKVLKRELRASHWLGRDRQVS